MAGSSQVAIGLVALIIGCVQMALIARQQKRLLRGQFSPCAFFSLLTSIRFAVACGVIFNIAVIGIWSGVAAITGLWLGRMLTLVATIQFNPKGE